MKQDFNKGFVVFSVLNCGISFAQWGYFFTLFNTLQSHFQNYVFPGASVNEISMIGSSPNFGGAIGVILAESLVTKLGRWKTMVLTDLIVLLGVALTMVASLPILIAGRTVIGFAIGLASVAVPLYITEMSPVEYRGSTGVFPAIGSCITRILSYMAGFLLPNYIAPGETDNTWRFLMAIPAVLNVVRLFNLFFILRFDTPFQLIAEKKHHEAKIVLSKIYKDNVEARYDELVEEVDYVSSESKIEFSDLLGPKFRKAFLLGVVVSVIEQACGVNVVYMFSNTIFETGLEPNDPLPKVLTTMVGFLALVFTVMAFFWLQRRGRKPLMVAGLIAMGIVDIAFSAIGYIDSIANPLAKIMILVWIAFFTWSFGSVMFLYLSECLPDKGFSATILLNWVLAFIVVQVTMNLAMWIGFEGSFLVFGALSFFGAAVIAKFLVESKGKTKLQILKEYCKDDAKDLFAALTEPDELLAKEVPVIALEPDGPHIIMHEPHVPQ